MLNEGQVKELPFIKLTLHLSLSFRNSYVFYEILSSKFDLRLYTYSLVRRPECF